MINQILTKLGIGDGSFNLPPESRRKYIRHEGGRAEVEVGNRAYSVRDWSMGGVLFDDAGEHAVNDGEHMQVTLRFRFPHETITIRQPARVIRAGKRGVSAEFAPMGTEERKRFERVMDAYYAQNFMESQVA